MQNHNSYNNSEPKGTVSAQQTPAVHSEIRSQIDAMRSRFDGREQISLAELIFELHALGHWLLCLFFSAPFLIPMPLPGLSTPFGIVIVIASIQIVFGRDPWIPAKLKKIQITASTFQRILDLGLTIATRIEKLIRPRLTYVVAIFETFRISAICIFVLATILALPMPPGFNALPSLAIICLCLGHLENDGIMTILGAFFTLVNIVCVGLLFFFGVEGLGFLLRGTN